jgi:cysteine desulfurase
MSGFYSPNVAYFDYASAFPPAEVALEAMARAARESWGHPGALHAYGARARMALDYARRDVAQYLGTMWQEVVFTANARSALRLGLATLLRDLPHDARIVASRQDHPALLRILDELASGRPVEYVELPAGVPNDEDFRRLATASVVVLSLVNHELGSSNRALLEAAPAGALRLVDAVQAAPWLDLSWLHDDRTYYAMSGAKLGAPGSAVLRVPAQVFYETRGKRQPLEGDDAPWLAAVGLGAACAERAPRRSAHLEAARARAQELETLFHSLDIDSWRNGSDHADAAPIVNVSFHGVPGKALASTLGLEGVAISHTSACQATRADASPVVRAAYPSEPWRAIEATRWALSELVTEADIARLAAVLQRALRASRDPVPRALGKAGAP